MVRIALRNALRPLVRGYATSVTGYGREVEGFVGAVGNTPLVGHLYLCATVDKKKAKLKPDPIEQAI